MSKLDDMIALARRAREHAYAPYSKFQVGACLRGDSGRLHVGCNVENASYPECQCAEASAIGALVAAGDKRILEVVVVSGGDTACPPCGGCRQRLIEFAGPDVPVHLCGPQGLIETRRLGELMPSPFALDKTTVDKTPSKP